MSKIYDGGFAFPSEQSELQDGQWNQTYDPGMSLRDWFAGHILSLEQGEIVDEKEVAKHCYKMADAMIKERDRDEN